MSNYSHNNLDDLIKLYELKKKNGLTKNEEILFLKTLIKKYHSFDKKKIYDEIVKEYKIRYIYNESKVEGNITPEEQLGIGEVYDYIQQFDFKKDYFNIFVTSLVIHQKLYSKCIGSGFGGQLRDSTACLYDTNIEVMDSLEAKKYFNSFINNSDFIFEPLKNNDILTYIEKCVNLTTELIKIQPFADGNKRTFRSLLNLLLKKITLPPIYIDIHDRKEYKTNLLSAMINDEYDELYNFYYKRIEESIIELDANNNLFLSDKLDNQKIKRITEDIRKLK